MVKPKRTKFSLEMVPWLVTDTPENYLKLLKAIDRPQFGAHIDAANMVISPRLYFNTGKMIQDCFALLGPWIVSCHAKDLVMKGGPGTISFHLDEVVPGEGNLDYTAYVTEIAKLGREVPLMLEHFDVPAIGVALRTSRRSHAAQGLFKSGDQLRNSCDDCPWTGRAPQACHRSFILPNASSSTLNEPQADFC